MLQPLKLNGLMDIRLSLGEVNEINSRLARFELMPVNQTTFGQSVMDSCPTCDRFLETKLKDTEEEYCRYCGQRLDRDNTAL